HGPAARAPGRDQTDVTVFLHAEADCLAPLVGLIVVVAPRVHAYVTPDRTHVLQLWRGNEPGRCRERRKVARDPGMSGDRRKRRRRPDRPAAGGAPHTAQLSDPAQPDEDLRLELPALHVGVEVG